MQAADQALQDSDYELACRLLLRAAARRQATALTLQARQRLADLKEEALQKWATAQQVLEDANKISPSDAADSSLPTYEQHVIHAFEQLESIVDRYRLVPGAGRPLTSDLSLLKRNPQYAQVLQEPAALELWKAGQELEQQGHACCAWQVYEEAVSMLPAPSAMKAEKRLSAMKTDVQLVMSVDACRQLQWCHDKYRLAEHVAKVDRDQAADLFRQIVDRAPADSRVHQAAVDALAGL